MSEPGSTRCLTCGQDAGPQRLLNRLPTGELCPTCHDRVLEGLPSLLPSSAEALEPESAEDEVAESKPGLRLLSGAEERAGGGEAPTAGA